MNRLRGNDAARPGDAAAFYRLANEGNAEALEVRLHHTSLLAYSAAAGCDVLATDLSNFCWCANCRTPATRPQPYTFVLLWSCTCILSRAPLSNPEFFMRGSQ